MDLKKLFRSLSARNWFVLACYFTVFYVSKVSVKAASWALFACLMPLAIYCVVRLVRSREFSGVPMYRIMLFTTAWIAVTTLINLRVSAEWILGFWFLLFCWIYLLFVPRDATEEELKREVFSLGMLILCVHLVLSLCALYSIFTGKLVHLPKIGNAIGIQTPGAIGEPIVIMAHHNTEGRIAWYCILFALYGILSHKNKVLRAFLAFAIVVNTMILAHSQSRTSYIGLAAALGLVSFRAAFLRLQRKGWRVLAGVLAAAVAFALVLGGLNLVYRADISVAKALKADQQAAAEADAGQEITSRVETDGQFAMFSNGRDDIWREVLLFLKSHPRYLLTGIGGTDGEAYGVIIKERTSIAMHANYHNAYLAVLGRGGIPLLAAVLAFLCLMVGPCWHVYFRRETPKSAGLFIVPIFVFTQLITCVTEVGVFTQASYSNMLFYFLCGVVLHVRFLSRQSGLTSGSR